MRKILHFNPWPPHILMRASASAHKCTHPFPHMYTLPHMHKSRQKLNIPMNWPENRKTSLGCMFIIGSNSPSDLLIKSRSLRLMDPLT